MPAYERPEVIAAPASAAEAQLADFLRGVYGWMCAGLAITAGTAWVVASSPSLVTAIFSNRLIFWALVIAQFGLVITLSARVAPPAPATASALVIVYSGLPGGEVASLLP